MRRGSRCRILHPCARRDCDAVCYHGNTFDGGGVLCDKCHSVFSKAYSYESGDPRHRTRAQFSRDLAVFLELPMEKSFIKPELPESEESVDIYDVFNRRQVELIHDDSCDCRSCVRKRNRKDHSSSLSPLHEKQEFVAAFRGHLSECNDNDLVKLLKLGEAYAKDYEGYSKWTLSEDEYDEDMDNVAILGKIWLQAVHELGLECHLKLPSSGEDDDDDDDDEEECTIK